MGKRKRKDIGLQNRLEIVIQSLLDFDEEGGAVIFEIEDGRLTVVVPRVMEVDGRLLLMDDEAPKPVMASESAAEPAIEVVTLG